jgi:hypothetical protein
MQNLFVVMLIIIGAAVALLVGLLLLQPSAPSGPSPTETGAEAIIPSEIEGFTLKLIERVDPVFEGELFSVMGVFVPKAGSPFEGSVESLGIHVFQLSDPQAAEEIEPVLLMSMGEEITISESLIAGVTVRSITNEKLRLAGVLWQEGQQLYYVLVSGAADATDVDLLSQAALVAAEAILKGE